MKKSYKEKELSNSQISITQICLIENNKNKVLRVTADLIADRLNKLAEEKGVTINLSTKDLLMSDEDYVKEKCIKELQDLKLCKFDIEQYIEILNRARKFNLYKVDLKIHQIVEGHYYTTAQYNKCIESYSNAYY